MTVIIKAFFYKMFLNGTYRQQTNKNVQDNYEIKCYKMLNLAHKIISNTEVLT